MPPTDGVKVDLGGKARTIRYTMGALDRLETETGLAVPQVQSRANIGSIRYLIWTIWAGLIHEEPGLERGTVIEWLDALSDEEAEALHDKLAEAWGRASSNGDAPEDAEGNQTAES
jgi:hypothetical protein